MRSSLFAVLCLLAAGAAASSCANPVFSNPSKYGGSESEDKLSLPSAPAAYPGGDTCTYYSGAQTCCSASTLSTLATTIKAVTEVTVETQKFLVSGVTASGFLTILNQLCQTVSCSTSVKNSIKNAETQMTTTVKQFDKDSLTCAHALAGYAGGMLCFACEAEWSQYVKGNNIILSTGTCDAMFDACQPMMNDWQTLLNQLQSVVNDVVSQLGGKKISVSDYPDYCGGTLKSPGDCYNYFCNQRLGGFGARIDAPTGPTPIIPPTELAAAVKAVAASPSPAAHAQLAALRIMHKLDRVSAVAHDLLTAKTADLKLGATTPINKYAGNGYPAYAVGCRDYSDCPAGGVSGWLVAFVVLLVLAVVGFAAFYIWKRRSGSPIRLFGGSGHSRLADSEPPSTATPPKSSYGATD